MYELLVQSLDQDYLHLRQASISGHYYDTAIQKDGIDVPRIMDTRKSKTVFALDH